MIPQSSAESLINAWIHRVGYHGAILTLRAMMPTGKYLHLDFYPNLLMHTYHMYLWYDASLQASGEIREIDIHQKFIMESDDDWDSMRDDIQETYGLDLESFIWEIVGSRP